MLGENLCFEMLPQPDLTCPFSSPEPSQTSCCHLVPQALPFLLRPLSTPEDASGTVGETETEEPALPVPDSSTGLVPLPRLGREKCRVWEITHFPWKPGEAIERTDLPFPERLPPTEAACGVVRDLALLCHLLTTHVILGICRWGNNGASPAGALQRLAKSMLVRHRASRAGTRAPCFSLLVVTLPVPADTWSHFS